MGRLPLPSALAALLFLAAPNAAALQRADLAPSSARQHPARSATDDSVALVNTLRDAQTNFERLRRRQLTRVPATGGGPCDETVGRYCYWDDDDTSEYALPEPRPKESPRTVAGRVALIRQLEQASATLPGDDWIAGQLVRYLIESGATDSAGAHAGACRATGWWCSALLGLVHHSAWRYPAADSAFASALAAMPERERCAWTDLTDLLPDSVRDGYDRATCADREAVNERIWWLADPLHLRPGNDRRTEHYARMVTDRFQRRAASGYGAVWRDDLGELLRRYGWPSYFAQSMPAPGRTEPPGVLAYDASPSYHFLADGDPRDDVRDMPDERWRLRPLGPRERYAPPYATFATAHVLTSLFRRGDSVLVLAAYDTRFDTLMPASALTAAITLSASPTSVAAQRVTASAPERGTLTVMMADTSALAAIEIIGGNRIHRARFAVGLPDSVRESIRISDVAFFQPSDSLPGTLDELLPLASASSGVQRDAKLGLFWELYGIRAADEDLTLRVQVIRDGRSPLRRAAERVGLVGRRGARGFGWREGDRGDGEIAARSVVVDLAGLDPGEYRIEVGLMRGSVMSVSTSRRLTITR